MRVLVTGATGFIGMHLVRHLANTGHEIIAIARRTPPSANSLPSIVWRHVDSLSQLASQLQTWEDGQIDAIVHLAARVHVLDHDAGNDTEAFRRTNVDDTLALARAAKRMGARRFVFMSSVKVHGDESGAEPLTEDSPCNPGDAYGRSKLDAEQALAEAAIGIDIVVLRPPLVYGPGVGANFHRLMKLVGRGWPLPFASVRNRRSLVYVGNLVDAIAKCLHAPEAAGQTFLVSDGADVSTPELLQQMATALRIGARLFPVSPSLLHAAARLAGKRELAVRLLESLAVDCRKLRETLAWTPPYSLEAGLAETAAWLREEDVAAPKPRK